MIEVTLSMVLCGIMLLSLFLNTILILNGGNVQHLQVVYNDFRVNITLSALEYSLTLLWYKIIYIYLYKSVFTYARFYSAGLIVNTCDNISDCTYL